MIDHTNFRGMIRKLRYLTPTRPNIVFEIRLVSRFMKSSHESHFQATKCILRNIKGMQNDDIFYGFGNKIELIRHIDGDGKVM